MGGSRYVLDQSATSICLLVDMALRFATRFGARAFCSKPAPLGIDGANTLSTSISLQFKDAGKFSFRRFFEEKYFWEKANLGPFFILLFFTPTIYRSFKDFYWTRQLRKLEAEEIISDRYDWLKLNMLQDEVEAVLLKQAGSVAALELGP